MTSQDVLGLKVVVIAGGWSDEKEISLDSGRACQKALTEAGFKGVDLLDAADGEFVSKLVAGGYDVAFVAMHGRYGEDGCIQGLLEILHMSSWQRGEHREGGCQDPLPSGWHPHAAWD